MIQAFDFAHPLSMQCRLSSSVTLPVNAQIHTRAPGRLTSSHARYILTTSAKRYGALRSTAGISPCCISDGTRQASALAGARNTYGCAAAGW